MVRLLASKFVRGSADEIYLFINSTGLSFISISNLERGVAGKICIQIPLPDIARKTLLNNSNPLTFLAYISELFTQTGILVDADADYAKLYKILSQTPSNGSKHKKGIVTVNMLEWDLIIFEKLKAQSQELIAKVREYANNIYRLQAEIDLEKRKKKLEREEEKNFITRDAQTIRDLTESITQLEGEKKLGRQKLNEEIDLIAREFTPERLPMIVDILSIYGQEEYINSLLEEVELEKTARMSITELPDGGGDITS